MKNIFIGLLLSTVITMAHYAEIYATVDNTTDINEMQIKLTDQQSGLELYGTTVDGYTSIGTYLARNYSLEVTNWGDVNTICPNGYDILRLDNTITNMPSTYVILKINVKCKSAPVCDTGYDLFDFQIWTTGKNTSDNTLIDITSRFAVDASTIDFRDVITIDTNGVEQPHEQFKFITKTDGAIDSTIYTTDVDNGGVQRTSTDIGSIEKGLNGKVYIVHRANSVYGDDLNYYNSVTLKSACVRVTLKPAIPKTLIDIRPATTVECTNGGVVILSGTDLNDNSILDDIEITTTNTICNGTNGTNGTNGNDGTDGQDGNGGANGHTSITTSLIITDDKICKAGGVIFTSFIDLNDNGVLDSGEPHYNNIICNGQDGTNGTNGQDGANGTSTRVIVAELSSIPTCNNGGIIITSYTDTNNNTALDNGEEYDSATICNGTNGTDGINGTDGQDGSNGTDGQDGTDGQNGINGTNGQNGTDGINDCNACDVVSDSGGVGVLFAFFLLFWTPFIAFLLPKGE